MKTKREFKGNTRGRDPKYPFKDLKAGECLIITPEGNHKDARRKVGTALYHYKRNNGLDWTTAVRLEEDKIYVYRIS